MARNIIVSDDVEELLREQASMYGISIGDLVAGMVMATMNKLKPAPMTISGDADTLHPLIERFEDLRQQYLRMEKQLQILQNGLDSTNGRVRHLDESLQELARRIYS